MAILEIRIGCNTMAGWKLSQSELAGMDLSFRNSELREIGPMITQEAKVMEMDDHLR